MLGAGVSIVNPLTALDYAENGVVKQLEVEAPGEFRVSSAEHMLTLV